MKRIDHPNVRVNFDTGNVTFYNRNADAVSELKEHNYRGPITLGVEGASGTELDEAETKKYVTDSVADLRSLAEFR